MTSPVRRLLAAALLVVLTAGAGCSALDAPERPAVDQPTPAPVPTDERTRTPAETADPRTSLRIDNDWSGPATVVVYLLDGSPSALDVTYANGSTVQWNLSDERGLAFQLNDLNREANVTDVRPNGSRGDPVGLVVEPGEASAEFLGLGDVRAALVVVGRAGDDGTRFEAVTGVRCDPGQRLTSVAVETGQWGGASGAGGCEPAG